MIKKLGRILTYIITFIGGFVAAIVALFKLAGKVLDTKSQFGWNGITTLKNYICDQVETLFFGRPRSSRTSSYYNYSSYNRYSERYKLHWTNHTFDTKETAQDFLNRLLECAKKWGEVRVRDVDLTLDEMGEPHNISDMFINMYSDSLVYSYGWTLPQIERAKPVHMNISGVWTVTLPQPQRL